MIKHLFNRNERHVYNTSYLNHPTVPMPGIPHDHGDMREIEEFREFFRKNNDFDEVSRVLYEMADGTRMRIFWLLCHYEGCVNNISAIIGMSSPAVSHHLRSLKSAGLVQSRREGKEVYYKAVDSDAARYLHGMIEDLTELSCPRGRSEHSAFGFEFRLFSWRFDFSGLYGGVRAEPLAYDVHLRGGRP